MTHDFQLWCEDCQQSLEGDCEEHGPLQKVADTEVSTRARRSIPHVLLLKDEVTHTGVYAKEFLRKRLQFGPLQAEKILAGSRQVTVEQEIQERFGIVFKITQEEGDYLLLDTQQEERSNWMIFVRPAEKKSEQNLVAFQYKGEIYFATIKEIPPQCELKVWFSKDYAERMGTRILAEEGVSWQFRTRQRFSCRGCKVVFSSAASLSNHRCSKAHQSSKGEALTSVRGRQGKKSISRGGGSQLGLAPSTSGKKTPPKSEIQHHIEEKERSSVKQELGSPASSTESEDPEPFPVTTPERRSPRSSPRGRGSVYSCSVCQKVFLSPGKLKQHSYSHTGERPFSCTFCHKAFSSRFKLVRHQLIHTTERQHQCPLCNRSFHRKDHLKNHIQIHDPNKQFKCERPDCGKEYNSYMSYRKHCAVHAAEEGDLQCKICQKMFETKSDLIFHLKVHVGSRTVKSPSEKKFQCDHCDRRFFTRKDVKRHLVVHTGKRDFSCTICPQKFGRKDHLVRHMKKSHGMSDVSRLEGLDVSTPGTSSATQAMSPSASVASSPPASGSQSIPMVIFPEPVAGPSGLSGTSSLLNPSGDTQYVSASFQPDFRIFEESIKEEPELQPSMEEIDPGGADLSKILGMYLPSGSMNIAGSPLLEPATHRTEEESQRVLLESTLLRLPQEEKGQSMLEPGTIFTREPMVTHPILSGIQSEEFGQGEMIPSTILKGDSPSVSGSSVHHSSGPMEQLSAESGEIPAARTTTTPTTSAAVTTTASLLPTLPGFDQAFP
ncbi:zinc finger protein PLAG1-like isoform X1 [Palaemon carinicauda]|uniref:zinc finger protein PLAG1-like isoform X1 n=2 Tax=Palaemon carinicauda TaxID=392227 RepID=UPI0035B69AAC